MLSDPVNGNYKILFESESRKKILGEYKQLREDLGGTGASKRVAKLIYNYLKDSGKELLDVIALKCNMPTFRVASLLLNMELKGVVRPLPGKQFEII